MLFHPEMMSELAHQRTDKLVDQATRYRLAAALRRGRRQLWPDSQRQAKGREAVRDAGRLAVCEGLPRVAGQAR